MSAQGSAAGSESEREHSPTASFAPTEPPASSQLPSFPINAMHASAKLGVVSCIGVGWVCNPADRRWSEQTVIGAALLLEESVARRLLLNARTSVRGGPGQSPGGSCGVASGGLWLRAWRAFGAPLLVLGVLLGAPTAAA